ncbi:MAG: LamB/YcsF family protein [bacterium]
MLDDRSVVSIEGEILRIGVASILVHGDTAGAVGIARASRARIEAGGGAVVPLSRL